jgi:glycosyltransferase involved in cell wall biosynthesis
MKILFIHNSYGKFSGEEAVVEAQIALLQREGHQIITYFRSSAELEKSSFAKMGAFFTGLYNRKAIADVLTIIQAEKPDVVHIHNLYPIISPAILPVIRAHNIPIVMTVHNYRLLCPNGLFFTEGKVCERCVGKGKELNCIAYNCENSCLKSAGYALRNYWARKRKHYLNNVDTFICLTHFQRNKLINNGFPSERCKVLSNFVEIPEKDAIKKSGQFVLFAGRLNSQKGFDILIEAASMMPEIKFRVAGDGEPDFLKSLTIPDNVTLEGKCDREKMNELYQSAALLAFTSRSYEGFPAVFPEAMLHRLPIVAPDMAGYPEVVEHGSTGWLFETGNSKSLAKAISTIIESPELAKKLGQGSFQKLTKDFGSKDFYLHLHEIYLAARNSKVIEKI